MIKEMIVDADLCIKLGGSDKYRYLYDVLPLVAEGKIELVNESGLNACSWYHYANKCLNDQEPHYLIIKDWKQKGVTFSLSMTKKMSHLFGTLVLIKY